MCWFPLFLHIGTFATQFTKYSVCEQKWNANLHTKSVHNDRVSVSGWLAGCAIWMAREYSIEKCRCDVQNIRTVGLHTKLFALYSMSVAGPKRVWIGKNIFIINFWNDQIDVNYFAVALQCNATSDTQSKWVCALSVIAAFQSLILIRSRCQFSVSSKLGCSTKTISKSTQEKPI